MGSGLRTATAGDPAMPPYSNGPYTWDADVTFTGTITFTGSMTFGDAALDTLTVNGATTLNSTLTVGVDDTGHDVKFFGATSGKSWLWDESEDKMIIVGDSQFTGAVTVGVDDTGHDVKLFGATAGAYLLWDESEDSLLLVGGAKTNMQGTLTVGVDDTGYDVQFFGATAGAHLLWDESEDSLLLVGGAKLNAQGTVTVGVDDTGYDVQFFGATAGAHLLWDESEDSLLLVGGAKLNAQGTVTVGVDDTGYDVKFFGATASKYWLWDESEDKMIIAGDSDITGASQFTGAVTVGVDDTGHDVKLFGATSGAYMLWDESEDELVLTNSTLQLGGKMKFALNGGAASASGLLMGVGTTANPATTSAAGNMFAEFRTQSTATSGDSRGLYWRHDLNGAGVSGEAIRAFSKITAAAATARGSHISLDVASAGSCSGLGVGVDSQILAHDGALTGGTYAVGNFEIYSAGSSTDVSGVTEMSFIRCVAGGDSTGAANVDDNAFFATFSGIAAGSGNIIDTDKTTHSAYGGLKVNIPGVGTKWLAIVSD